MSESEHWKKIKAEMMLMMKYSDEILDIIEHQDEFTRSDLQGVVEAVVLKIMRGEK